MNDCIYVLTSTDSRALTGTEGMFSSLSNAKEYASDMAQARGIDEIEWEEYPDEEWHND